jgi:hypothetical protein
VGQVTVWKPSEIVEDAVLHLLANHKRAGLDLLSILGGVGKFRPFVGLDAVLYRTKAAMTRLVR